MRFEGIGQGVYDLDTENLPRDGEWHEVEFPVSDLFAQGLVWEGEQQGVNYFSLVSETAEQGAVLDFDGAYFYATGLKDDAGVVDAVSGKENKLLYAGDILYAAGEGMLYVYSVSGQLVYSGNSGNGVGQRLEQRHVYSPSGRQCPQIYGKIEYYIIIIKKLTMKKFTFKMMMLAAVAMFAGTAVAQTSTWKGTTDGPYVGNGAATYSPVIDYSITYEAVSTSLTAEFTFSEMC